MKKHKSPVKAARQDIKRHQRNVSYKHMIATNVKKVISAVSAGDKTKALADLKEAQAIIDGSITKNILHKKTAARRVSRIARKVAKMA